jgi:hypothetical protein
MGIFTVESGTGSGAEILSPAFRQMFRKRR